MTAREGDGPPRKPTARRRLLRLGHSDPFLRTAYSLILNVVVIALLGFGFWIVAARLLPTSAVGRDSALVSSMIALSAICQLNLAAGIYRFLPVTRLHPGRIIVGVYGVTGAVAAVAATGFVLIAPSVSDNYLFLRDQPWLAVLYVGAVVLWGVFNLQDAALTALRRAPWVPIENATFGILKIALLPVLLAVSIGHSIFVSWVIPMVLLLIPVNLLLFLKAIPKRPPLGEADSPVQQFGRRGLARFLAQDYLATIFVQTGTMMLPAVVVAVIGSSRGAHFYMPFIIVTAFDLIFVNVAFALTIEGAVDARRFPLTIRAAVRRFGALLAGGVALLAGAATLILQPFGASYAAFGAPALRLLACASVARAVLTLSVAINRVEGRASRNVMIQGLVLVLVMGLTVVLGRDHGVTGVAVAWLIANAVAACVALPHVVGTLRRGAHLARSAKQGAAVRGHA